MAQSKLDLSVLRGALGVFAICVLVAGILLGASYYFREEMAAEFNTNQLRFRDVSRKYLSVDEEERIIEQYLPEFQQLYDDGVLGREKRLSWLEVLKAAGAKVQLPQLGYEISSQSTFEPDYPVDVGAFDIYASNMDLNMGLLHEGDLLNVLELLDQNANGLYSVSHCDVARTVRAATADNLRERIKAVCQLRWFTVDLKGDRELTL